MNEQGASMADSGANTFLLTPGCFLEAYCLYKGDPLAWSNPDLADDRNAFVRAIESSITANKERIGKPSIAPSDFSLPAKEEVSDRARSARPENSQVDPVFSALNALRPIQFVAGKTVAELDALHGQIDDAIERLRTVSTPLSNDEPMFEAFAEAAGLATSHFSVPHASYHSVITRFSRLAWLARSFLNAVPDERFVFENLARAMGEATDRSSSSNGAYEFASTRCAWLAWQASAQIKRPLID